MSDINLAAARVRALPWYLAKRRSSKAYWRNMKAEGTAIPRLPWHQAHWRLLPGRSDTDVYALYMRENAVFESLPAAVRETILSTQRWMQLVDPR